MPITLDNTSITGLGVGAGIPANTLSGRVAAANAPLGSVIQVVTVEDGTFRSTSSTIPKSSSVPTSSQGAEFLTLNITPRSSASSLLFLFEAYATETSNQGDNIAFTLFKGSETTARNTWHIDQTSQSVGQNIQAFHGHYIMQNDTTSTTTYRVRYGVNSGSVRTLGGSTYYSSGDYGSTVKNRLTIMEIL